ncbi:collagen alpha-1(I) chain [Gorilla gorilla gorilla]|uniref:collagen alpha-1(I) chain n=1 Tax=Gorilla gorilla gorilla TaxID=9595 RepID=UPI0024460C78|nr:collagen alpha-1(I) chain [Gorilla gorilla gorilla]
MKLIEAESTMMVTKGCRKKISSPINQISLITFFVKGKILVLPRTYTLDRKRIEATRDCRVDHDILLGQCRRREERWQAAPTLAEIPSVLQTDRPEVSKTPRPSRSPRVTERSAPLPPAQPPAGVRQSPLETPTSRGSAAPVPTQGRQGAGGSSSPGASPAGSPPPARRPLTDFHSAVVQARSGGLQGVEAAVQRGGAVAQRGRLALELAEDVPGAARQVGQLRQQAAQGMRADLLQRAEERRARSPGPRRLGPAQPRGLQGPLVEGHGGGGPAAQDPSVRPPSARGASLHPTQRKSRAAAGRRGKPGGPCPQGRGRAGRKDGRTGARASGHPGGAGQDWGPSRGCLAPSVPPPAGLRGPRGERKFQGQLWAAAAAAARGAASPAEVCRRAGKRRLLLPSLRIGEGGGSEGSAADTGREGGEAKERKGGGEKGRPGNHLRLPRPPRPAPAASGGPGASAHPTGAGAGSQSRDAHVAAPTPLGSPRAVGQSPRPPPGPGWSAVRAPGRRRHQDGRGQLRSLCSPAPLPTALRSQERPAPRGTPRAPRGPPVSPTSLLEGGQHFWAARVDLKENVFKCPVAKGSVAD